MNIPFVNLKRMHEPIRQEIDAAVKNVIDANNYINGKQIAEFETNFARYLGVKNVIGISSGTDALFLALIALDIKMGDYVVTVPNTFIATTEAITQAGGRVAFVDADETSSNMCPQKLETFLKKCTFLEKIKAIIFVDLYGNPEGLDKISEIAKKYNIALISDAAQAHGATINNKPITDFADITTYSFFPGKNLGAFGDAGAVALDNDEMAGYIKMLRNHGRTEKYFHTKEAFNCRIDTIQAAVLDVKLKSLTQWTDNRINTAKIYNRILKEKGYFIPEIGEKYKPVFHLYVTRVENREQLMANMKEAGIATGIHYPVPLHLQPAYSYLEYKKGDFPVSEKLTENILSLPVDGSITEEEAEYVAKQLP
ncbi:MAG: DegT/DnrJ/EryC1/StrS family aminotransferase [bacterium]|nr:DegT/DnrJ/EryC1/StrS family aminotransferase [bacterium]